MVAEQMTRRSLPTSEDPSLNPVIGNFYCRYNSLLLILSKIWAKPVHFLALILTQWQTKFGYRWMMCLGFEPKAAVWLAQTNPQSYSRPQLTIICLKNTCIHQTNQASNFYIPRVPFIYFRSFQTQYLHYFTANNVVF